MESPIGTAGFYVAPYKKSHDRGHIYTVYVRDEVQGNGVGDRLIEEFLGHAGTLVQQVHLDVPVTAKPAIWTYERSGFEIYGTDPNAIRIGETKYNQYLMVRKIDRSEPTLPDQT